jgi:hypothetical protein
MKNLYLSIISIFVSFSMLAQTPQGMSYQAVVRDGSGALVTNQSVGMAISILQGSSLGTTKYAETHTITTNANGLVSLEIGKGTVIQGSLSTIDWGSGPYFVKTETDPNGGSNYTISGTSELLSVPFALHAKAAETYTETDPLFSSSLASGITAADTANWNSSGSGSGGPETDPIFSSSLASGITAADTANWNSSGSGGGGPETDPIFSQSPASGITTADINNWNDTSSTGGGGGGPETDPIFSSSVAGAITAADTTYWGNKVDFSELGFKWNINSNGDAYTYKDVAIGYNFPYSRLDLYDTLSPTPNFTYNNTDFDFTLFIDAISGNNPNNVYAGTFAKINGTAGQNAGLLGLSDGINSTQQNCGVYGEAVNAFRNYGVWGKAVQINFDPSSTNFGIGGEAANSGFSNIGVSANAVGGLVVNSANNFGVFAEVDNYTDGANYGVYAKTTGASGLSTGSYNYAIYGDVSAAPFSNTWAGYFNGDVQVIGTLYQTSDRKFKTNISKLTEATSVLRQLKPVEYDYKEKYTEKGINLPKGHQYGFIAQDLEKVLPNSVASSTIHLNQDRKPGEENEFEEFLGVNYISIIPILTQALKEQDDRILELEKKILELEKKMK